MNCSLRFYLLLSLQRLAQNKRETRAAICIQRYYRGYRCRFAFVYVREAVITIQSFARGMFARDLKRKLLYQAKTVVIQRWWRGYLGRKKYRNYMKKVVYLQCCVRRMLARRELKALKVLRTTALLHVFSPLPSGHFSRHKLDTTVACDLLHSSLRRLDFSVWKFALHGNPCTGGVQTVRC